MSQLESGNLAVGSAFPLDQARTHHQAPRARVRLGQAQSRPGPGDRKGGIGLRLRAPNREQGAIGGKETDAQPRPAGLMAVSKRD